MAWTIASYVLGLVLWCFSYIVAVSFIGWGNRSIGRKP